MTAGLTVGLIRIEPIDEDEFFFIQGFMKFNRNQNGDGNTN